MNLYYKKHQRLLKNDEFKAVLKGQKRFTNSLFEIYYSENKLGYWRVGISVRAGCGCAVVRNRIKRLTREVFRVNQKQIPAGYDYVVIAAKKINTNAKNNLTYYTFKNNLLGLLGKAIKLK